eukprot:755161-Hanusia_phi.AAC.1
MPSQGAGWRSRKLLLYPQAGRKALYRGVSSLKKHADSEVVKEGAEGGGRGAGEEEEEEGGGRGRRVQGKEDEGGNRRGDEKETGKWRIRRNAESC